MTTIIVDDRDPSIAYSGYWGGGGSSHEYEGTITYANSIGPTIQFATVNFTGSRISVYGTIRAGDQPSSNYTVDTPTGSKTTVFKLPDANVSAVDMYNYTFFQSDPLSSTGQHLLVIRPMAGTLYLDSFAIVQGNISAFSPTSSSTQQSATATAKATATASAVTGGQSKSNSLVAPIIGGALGALALICIFVLALFWIRRKRGEDHSSENTSAPTLSERAASLRVQARTSIDPFDVPPRRLLDRKGQPPFVATGTAQAVTPTETITSSFYTGPVQHSSTSPTVTVATTTAPSSSGNMTNSSNFVAASLSVSGDQVNDPPPGYHG